MDALHDYLGHLPFDQSVLDQLNQVADDIRHLYASMLPALRDEANVQLALRDARPAEKKRKRGPNYDYGEIENLARQYASTILHVAVNVVTAENTLEEEDDHE